eukprot:5464603-Amphidinium_carterae.1
MTSSEGATWLVKLVGTHGTGGLRIKSHSLKVTLLSWLAKAGADVSVRRILGYHIDPADKSALTYSRDAMSGPLR